MSAGVAWVFAAALLLAAALYRWMPSGRETARRSLGLLLLFACLEGLARLPVAAGSGGLSPGLHGLVVLGLGVVLIRLSGLLLFRVALPALDLRPPRIVEDIVVIVGYLLWALLRLSAHGVELTGLVATSAVVTAVLAFAMQDTLGNILGGLALQLDDSVAIGDWVRLDEVSGQVVEIQWRFTAILTRNGERVVVPNAQLMKAKFTVVGRRPPQDGGPPTAARGCWRRAVAFPVDYSVDPAQVIAAAEACLHDAEIANVARQPAPSCIAADFTPGAVRYLLRYWITDPRDDDPADSAVRVHLLAALQRRGWRIALPDQIVHQVVDDQAHREEVQSREQARRLAVLAGIDLFGALDDEERRRLARRLAHAPFARGDTLMHQGEDAHWLYMVARGQAEVWQRAGDGSRQRLGQLHAGDIVGEMGLLTGEPRVASVVAVTELDGYRLDKADLQDLLHARPALAERLSQVLDERRRGNARRLTTAPEGDERGAMADSGADLLGRIRHFFGLC